MSKTVLLVVNDANRPPAVPVLVSPIGGAVVASGGPPLTWANASDPDGDPVTYDVELYDTDTDGVPAQAAFTIAGGVGITPM